MVLWRGHALEKATAPPMMPSFWVKRPPKPSVPSRCGRVVWVCVTTVAYWRMTAHPECALEHEMRIKVKSSRTLKCKAHRPFVDQFTARVLLSSI